jgi:LmbE family N-acetylglucosaminyl deacetylase
MIREYLRRLYRTALPLIYGRSQFKLFLNTTLGTVDLRMLALASQTDYFTGFVRAIPIRAPFGKSVLVLAPHQDDETIGCGGALALQVASGNAAAIVMLQDGASGSEELGMSREALNALRNEESRRAAAVIHLPPPIFLNHPDLAASIAEASASVRRILLDRKVDAVFVPFVLDGHPDHRVANFILVAALDEIPWDVRILGYEVWGMCIPNVIVVIDEVMEQKLAMLACFEFANKALDYVHSTKGLNMFHSRMLGAGECRYAERFFEVPRREYIELVKRVQAAESQANNTRIGSQFRPLAE